MSTSTISAVDYSIDFFFLPLETLTLTSFQCFCYFVLKKVKKWFWFYSCFLLFLVLLDFLHYSSDKPYSNYGKDFMRYWAGLQNDGDMRCWSKEQRDFKGTCWRNTQVDLTSGANRCCGWKQEKLKLLIMKMKEQMKLLWRKIKANWRVYKGKGNKKKK